MAYPMNFTFDERGRMWVIEPRDYPFIHDTTTGFPTNTSNGIASNRLAGKGRILIFEDVNGDGKSDIVWRDAAGIVYLWFMNGGALIAGPGIGAVASATARAGAPASLPSSTTEAFATGPMSAC